jgi:hypothetical protein
VSGLIIIHLFQFAGFFSNNPDDGALILLQEVGVLPVDEVDTFHLIGKKNTGSTFCQGNAHENKNSPG